MSESVIEVQAPTTKVVLTKEEKELKKQKKLRK